MSFRVRRVLLGTAVGVLPGIGPALAVALLLPVTFKLDPAGSLIMFAGICYGGVYGGSTTSILLNTPGETRFHHHRAQKQSRARAAAGRAGDRGDRLVRGRHYRDRALGAGRAMDRGVAGCFDPGGLFHADGARLVAVSASFGIRPSRGGQSLFIELRRFGLRHRHRSARTGQPRLPLSACRRCSTASA